ncbi:MAG: hypothetical protein A2474_05035 [Elusimicrobia bacterium RIFOXYC2_FULL_34_12]|nr:MAG: hypothetical protein A2474_05035 [Elusimicrobia bacterium RIFOXYC2_FULL_34_12]OGS38363.1 MAG: hypothetical protein A2551_07165 [Elusimicrobia bacterium RIFOXYD2_FULL_34_30]HAM38406.1 acylphosphatase [Elusimicrobiota bacterium]
MFSYHIMVSGQVQGIGYRYFVEREARKIKITGWVRNLDNSDVEILAEGEEIFLEDFVNTLQTKHSYAIINDIKVSKTKIEKTDYSDFKITF